MDRLEDALKQALRRQEAPEELTRRILVQVPGLRPAWRDWFRLPNLRWAAAVAGVLVLLLSVQYNAERRRRAEGEAAKTRMLTALRITADKLEYARLKVQQVTAGGEGDTAEPQAIPAARPANSI
jgi:hypothetical protein